MGDMRAMHDYFVEVFPWLVSGIQELKCLEEFSDLTHHDDNITRHLVGPVMAATGNRAHVTLQVDASECHGIRTTAWCTIMMRTRRTREARPRRNGFGPCNSS